MIHKQSTARMSRDEWLTARMCSLGGSDMGAVLGLNKYRSPFAVWAEKTGRVTDTADNEAMRQGRDLEDYVAQRFQEVSGKRVQRLNAILRNDDVPYIHANIDRRVLNESAGLECKTASVMSMKLYKNGEFPESYYAQCVSYLAVTGWQRWYLAALILNRAFFVYQMTTVPDDPCPEWCESSVFIPQSEIDELKDAAKTFWESYVIPDVPPPVDGSDSTGKTLSELYRNADDEAVDLSDLSDLTAQYFALKRQADALKTSMETIKQTIQLRMRSAERATVGDACSVTWKPQTRFTFDAKRFQKDHPDLDLAGYYKTTSTRVFKISARPAGN